MTPYATPRKGVIWVPRKRIEIKTVSYVHVGDKLVNTEDLNEEQRLKLAAWLNCTYLNAFYQGKAVFYCEGGKGCEPNRPPDCPWKFRRMSVGMSAGQQKAGG